MSKLFNVEEAAEMLHVTKKTINKWIRDGRIKASKIGKSYLISEVDLFKFVESNRR